MNILTDYHHGGLSYSFHLLFEKRLGHSILRPIGMEWFERGFWDIAKPYNNDIGTVKQFLSMRDGHIGVNGSPPLNTIVGRNSSAPYYTVYDAYHDYHQKAMTFAQFIDTDIDVIIATIPDHWYTYKRLRDQFKPKAKLICHMGNMFNEVHQALIDGTIDNLLASTIGTFPVPAQVNKVFYYQEQPLIDYAPPKDTKHISSYAHVLPKKNLYDEYKSALPDYTFKAYGAGCPDGWMDSIQSLYASMQEDQFVYHVKPGGDGYGWNWHSAFMVGRPIITNFSDYKDKLGGLLFEDQVTGIDLEKRSLLENCELIKNITQSSHYLTMAQECRKRFDQLVNYDNEQKKVEAFLNNLR